MNSSRAKTCLMYRYSFLLLISFFIVQDTFGQNPVRSGQDYAVFFYTTTFQPGWEALPDTRTDAETIAKELKDNYGFQVEFVPNPKKEDIENKILELNNRHYGPKDQLLLFFSMHGHFLESADRGYLIPADGKTPPNDPLGKSWLSYDDLGTYLALNPCQHILLSLDACYSGAFGDRWMSYPGSVSANADAECKVREENALYHVGRLYFTSGSRERRVPAQSKFAKSWLRALQEGRSKKIMDTNELRYHFGSIPDPKPEGGSFTKDHKGGDFIFIHKTACSSAPVTNQTADRNAWQTAKIANSLAAYQQYRSQFPNGEFRPLADQRIAELEEKKDWDATKKADTITAYEDFIKKYPNSPYLELAKHYRLQLESKTTFDDLPNMVFVQRGNFTMGSEKGDKDEKPVHNVTLGDFNIGRYEVTVAMFDAFVSATNYKTDAEKGDGSSIWTGSNWAKKAGINWRHDASGKSRPSSEYNHPVVHISWNDAVAYCNWRSEEDGLQKVYTISGNSVNANWNANGYRLPTEAEWEFAARNRGGNQKWAGAFSETNLSEYANYDTGDKKGKEGYINSAPIGSFRANGLGLHDMSGNVYEWCWDWKAAYTTSSQTNPHGPNTGTAKVCRGGAWSNKLSHLRCTNRYSYYPDRRAGYIGFRLAKTAR